MGRLTESAHGGAQAIGRDGLLRFIDELNEKRARRGIRQRYYAIEENGVLTMQDDAVRPRLVSRQADRKGSSQSLSAALPSAYAAR